MKKISPPICFYGAILHAFFNFLKAALFDKKGESTSLFYIKNKTKGVGHKPFGGQIVCNFDCLGRKISEKILVEIKYVERSKNLLVAFKSKDKDGFAYLPKAMKNSSAQLLASFFNELAWGLAELLFEVEKPNFKNFDFYILPVVKKDFSCLNPYEIIKKQYLCSCFTDDILCILHNVYNQRKNQFSFVEITLDEIIFLRGNKSARKQDRKRVLEALDTLCALNLIRIKKIQKYKFAFCVLQNRIKDGFLIPREILSINPSNRYFEKFLGVYLCYLASMSCFEFKLNIALKYLCKNKNPKRPFLLRDRIERAFDFLQKVGIISKWEYKKIDENRLCGENWLYRYSKLKIIFCIKKRDKFVSCPV